MNSPRSGTSLARSRLAAEVRQQYASASRRARVWMAGRSLAKLVGVGLGTLLLVACGVNPTPQGERLTETRCASKLDLYSDSLACSLACLRGE